MFFCFQVLNCGGGEEVEALSPAIQDINLFFGKKRRSTCKPSLCFVRLNSSNEFITMNGIYVDITHISPSSVSFRDLQLRLARLYKRDFNCFLKNVKYIDHFHEQGGGYGGGSELEDHAMYDEDEQDEADAAATTSAATITTTSAAAATAGAQVAKHAIRIHGIWENDKHIGFSYKFYHCAAAT